MPRPSSPGEREERGAGTVALFLDTPLFLCSPGAAGQV